MLWATPKVIRFPEDEQAHPTIVEWWYLNGHATDRRGRRYHWMSCLFKADPRRIKLPFFRFLPLKTAYFIHEIITDVEHGTTQRTIIPLTLAEPESFTRPLLYVAAGSWTLTQKTTTRYHLTTSLLDLELEAKKPPLLENQTGFIDLGVKTTFYYTLPRLATLGHLKLGGGKLAADGMAWLDHQWADCGWQPADDIWTWFSLQLANGVEAVVFRYGGATVTELATVSYPDSTQTTTRQISLTPRGQPWQSIATGARYQLSWHIELTDLGFEAEVRPINQEQEMIFGPLNYWEGGILVQATFRGQPCAGVGFLELAGVPIATSRRKLFEQQLQATVRAAALKLENKISAAAARPISTVKRLLRRR